MKKNKNKNREREREREREEKSVSLKYIDKIEPKKKKKNPAIKPHIYTI